MKKINIFLFSLLSLIVISSCSDTEDPKIGTSFTSPVLEQIIPQNLVFTEETNLTDGIGYWTWQKSDYGIPTGVTYTVEADTAGGDFTSPITLVNSETNYVAITAGMLNNAASNFVTESKVVTLDIRLKSDISAQVAPIYSNIESVTFTGFVATKDVLYIIGDGLAGWDNSAGSIGNNLQVFFSNDSKPSSKQYTYTGYFNGGGGLKFIVTAGNWGTAYAHDGTGKIAQKDPGDNIPTPTVSGYYTLNVDLKALTYEFVPFDASAAPTYTTVGIVGDATPAGWDVDTELTQVIPHIWVKSSVNLTAGELKFRANKGWDVNWGGSSENLPFGLGVSGGDNFKNEKATTHFIAINDLTGHYVIIPTDKLP